jgi:hypothetical protein
LWKTQPVTTDADPAGKDTDELPEARVAEPPGQTPNELLAAAPLDGIDLARNRDFGRDVEL